MTATTDATDQPREYRQLAFARPSGACDILLVRHGESEPWREDRPFPVVDGHDNPPLDPNGHRQAELVGARLAGEAIDAIYITPLQRTAQTAAPLAAALGLTPVVEPELREVHLGEWEGGRFRKFVTDGHPLAERMQAEQRWDVLPGAEPGDAFAARVAEGLARIAQQHPDQCVAVFTHGGVISQVLASATGARLFAFLSDNAAISHVVWDAGSVLVRRYNDTIHLRPHFTHH